MLSYFSCPLLTSLSMLWPMIFLTVNAAIFHEFASSTYLQFDVIDGCFAAVSTHFVGGFFSI